MAKSSKDDTLIHKTTNSVPYLVEYILSTHKNKMAENKKLSEQGNEIIIKLLKQQIVK